ncbi:hypothetical protein J1N35_042309 [Gossypium stocksii]|uniref:Uncharacterized protein n=1 Tax=Gossypium stocksii TaxID=47602 RepID=A0A9D3UH28_9ROSI|nr:hypothetical protein J1N35_042309 [Gossypium stocksii]
MTDARRAIGRLNGFVIIGNRLSVELAKYKGKRMIWKKKSRVDGSDGKGKMGEKGRESYEKEGSDVRLVSGECSMKKHVEWKLTEEGGDWQMKAVVTVQRYVEDEQLWKLQKSVVGVTASCNDLKAVQERLTKAGLVEIQIRRIQGAKTPWASIWLLRCMRENRFKAPVSPNSAVNFPYPSGIHELNSGCKAGIDAGSLTGPPISS